MKNNLLTKEIAKKWSLWLIMTFSILVVPSFISFFASMQLISLKRAENVKNVKQKLQQARSQGFHYLDQELYFCQSLYAKFNHFRNNKTPIEDVIKWLEKEREIFEKQFDFLVWKPSGKVFKKTFNSIYTEKDWEEVFLYLASNDQSGLSFTYKPPISSEFHSTAKKVLGPLISPSIMREMFRPGNYSLTRPDSAMTKPLLWTFFLNNSGYILLFNPEIIKKNSGLRYFLKEFSSKNEQSFGLFSPQDNKIWLTSSNLASDSFSSSLNKCETEFKNFIETKDYFISFSYLSPKYRIFSFSRKKIYENYSAVISLAIAFLPFLFLLPAAIYIYNTVVKGKPGYISIRTKMAFIFLISNGIPILVLGMISHENHLQKKETLLKEKLITTNEMLKSFSSRFQSYLSQKMLKAQKQIKIFEKNSQNKDLKEKDFLNLNEVVAKNGVDNFFLISSATKSIVAKGGIFYYKGGLDNPVIDEKRSKFERISKVIKDDIMTSNLAGKKILNDANGTPIPNLIISKLEIILESLLQKTMTQITYSLLQSVDRLSLWGFGSVKHILSSSFLSIQSKDRFDYLFMIFWRPFLTQEAYLTLKIPQANRNSEGIKIIAIEAANGRYVVDFKDENHKIQNFSQQLSDKPLEEIEKISYQGEEYLVTGFKSKEMPFFNLVGMYPVRNINRILEYNLTGLFLAGIFCIVLSLALAQLVSKSFIAPLQLLQKGALAIEKMDFDHRIKGVPNDEFGKIANIFNHIMVDLEELEVAKVVQESLFPKSNFQHGYFSVYGKSIAMAELGGDYFDFFEVSETNFSMMLGDVAGHGVAAAVIMAMAKAGVVQSEEYLKKPSELMLRLHKLILASKTKKQRKIMTCQYFYLDSNSGKAQYSNAGGCSPIIIRRKKGVAEELTLQGAALGAFKKATYEIIDVQLDPEDAIIFYTDGIVETRNSAGEELGYEGFKAMLLKAWNIDSESYYNNIYQAYLNHLGDEAPQDDLTIIVATFNKELQSLKKQHPET